MDNYKIDLSEVFEFKNKIDYSTGGVVSKKVIQKGTGNVTLFVFDKGQELSEHSTPFNALVQVLEGEAMIVISKVGYLVKGGQSIIMPANLPHAVKAKEKFKMLLTMIKE
ncbi:MAG: cupin domain-containing protein [Ignavibacteriales bacterium]|nr:cupin domain-containing protein [Ignavibacteriales bacterium]